MTEKRFYYAHGVVWDTKKLNGLNGISINDLDKGLRVAIWLNELNDENKQLKEALIELKEIGDYQYARIKELSDENEQLKKQLASINRLIDNKIDEFKNGDYGDLPCNTIHMFLDLKQELGDLE